MASKSNILIKEEAEEVEIESYFEALAESTENTEEQGNITDAIEPGDDAKDDDDEGTFYFVDSEGNYYYQSSKEPKTITDGNDSATESGNENAGNADDTEYVIKEGDADASAPTIISKKKATKIKKQQGGDEVSYLVIMDDQENDVNIKEGVGNNINENNSLNQTSLTQEDINEIVEIRKKKDKKQDKKLLDFHKCNFCDYVSPRRYLLARHLRKHSDEKPFKCSICERGFKTQASLQNHVNTHTGVKPHVCSYCESCFTTSGELVRHVRYRHTLEKPHRCHICDYASVELSKLKRHIRCHTGERPFQCPHCTYASPDTFKLKRHIRIHTGEKPYECDICHARFTQSNSLKSHKLIHSVGDKPVFHCELCPTTCGRKTDLRIHVQKLHTSDQPIKCRRCDQLFPDRYSYKVHTKTHDGEKCFKCEICPYASISARHLESHMLIHTDEKPFECPNCIQSFRQKQLLKRHINLYHNKNYKPPKPKPKNHQCPDCDRSFSHKGNLIRHMAIHDPNSTVKKEAFALRIGRQKKLFMLNDVDAMDIISDDNFGEYITDDKDDNNGGIELEAGTTYIDDGDNSTTTTTKEITIKQESNNKDDNILTIQSGESGEHYVVLEVIQSDNDTTTQHITDDIDNNVEDLITDDNYTFSGIDCGIPEQFTNDKILKIEEEGSKNENTMEICFGFEEDMEGELDYISDDKPTITLLKS